MNRKSGIILAVCALLLVLGAGVWYGFASGNRVEPNPAAPPESPAAGDMNTAAVETNVVLAETGFAVSGTGAAASERTLTITQGGTYRFSGSMEGGQIVVNADGKDSVILIFNGMELSHTASPVIYVENAGQTTLLLADGTENTLKSGVEAALSSADSEENDAAGGTVYARDDLFITGGGTLTVFGYLNNGIHTTDRLTIDSGTLQITARNNALKGKDAVSISGGSFTLNAGNDGIKADDTKGEGYGVILLSDGVFQIESGGDAIQAETRLEITGGDYTIRTGGGSETAAPHYDGGWGGWGRPDSDWDLEDENEPSTKGLKSGGTLEITGGTFTLDCRDDALHSNGAMVIDGGDFTIASGDDGIHAETELSFLNGKLLITGAYEGIEANQLLIGGGEITLTAADDGLNAFGGRGGWGSAKRTDETPVIRITGGSIRVNANGDGLDSNGSIFVEDGTVLIDGPSDHWNGAIDIGTENGGVCEISGGTVLTLGSSGMAESFGSGSEQCSFRHNFSESFREGDRVTVTALDGTLLLEHTAVKSGNSVVFSCPQLSMGETYRLTAGTLTAEIVLNAVSTLSGASSGRRW